MQAVHIWDPVNFFLLLFFAFYVRDYVYIHLKKPSLKYLVKVRKIHTTYGNAQCTGVWLFWRLKTCISLLPNNAQRAENNLCKIGIYLNNLFYDKPHTIIFPADTQHQNNIQTTLFQCYSDIVCLLCFKNRTTKIADLKNAFLSPQNEFQWSTQHSFTMWKHATRLCN